MAKVRFGDIPDLNVVFGIISNRLCAASAPHGIHEQHRREERKGQRTDLRPSDGFFIHERLLLNLLILSSLKSRVF